MKNVYSTRSLLPLLAGLLLWSSVASAQRPRETKPVPRQQREATSSAAANAPSVGARISEEKTGSLSARAGQRLRLTTDTGNIRIQTRNTGQVSYRVRIETSATDPGAKKFIKQFVVTARNVPDGILIHAQSPGRESRGHLWVTFDVNVPHHFQVDVSTQGGSIESEDIDGRINFSTQGGDLVAGNVGAAARLETQGGHITARDIAGELVASTAGGHVSVGNVQGDATVRTGGGHLRIASIIGKAELETGGGNIYLQRAGAYVIANTVGGRIDFGEAAGGVRARTGGGSIGVLNVAGPTEVESFGGGICLTKVQGSVKASTAKGPITAYLVAARPMARLHGPSQLVSGQGDIIVFIPREIAITIDAVIEAPAEHRIEFDPGIPLKVSYGATSSTGRPVRGEGALNGGGEILRLRTVAGNIRLRWADATSTGSQAAPLPGQIQFDKFRYYMDAQQKVLEEILKRQQELIEKEIPRKLKDSERELSRMQSWQRKITRMVSGRVRVPPQEQREKLVQQVRPDYPFQAKKMKVEGRVRLEVFINADGKVENVNVLSGHPLLAPAAIEAVKQWRYEPTLLDGQAIPVVTTVDIEFRLDSNN